MKLRVILMAVFCFTFGGLSVQANTDDPVTLVQTITSDIFAKVTENYEEYATDNEALKSMVKSDLMPLLDIDYASRLILGRAGRGVEQAKIDEFSDLMSNMLVDRYSTGLLHFNSQDTLRVLPQRGELNPKLTRVRTRVKMSNGSEAPVDYAFHKTENGWKAFDLIVEGISYITTYRNQIMPDVQANGIDSVIEKLSKGELDLAD